MAGLYKRGKIYWYSASIEGEVVRRSTGLASKKQAQEYAEKEIAKLKLAAQRGYDPDMTVGDAVIAYQVSGKDNRFLDKLVEHWNKKKIRTIKPEWVRKHAPDLYPDAKPATLNRQVITPLQAVINFAYQAEDGRKIKIEKFNVVDAKKKQAVDSTWHEKFAAHALSPGMAAMARFMYETAARISEACRVMPEDIDLDARTVWLSKTKTKPRLTRVSHGMAAQLRELMAAGAKRNRMNKGKANGIFGYASRHAVYNGWKTACDRAGISYSPPHSSGRVTFATELVVRRKIDPVTAASLGGWASPKVMMDTYAKAEGQHQIVDAVFGATGAKELNLLHNSSTADEKFAPIQIFDDKSTTYEEEKSAPALSRGAPSTTRPPLRHDDALDKPVALIKPFIAPESIFPASVPPRVAMRGQPSQAQTGST